MTNAELIDRLIEETAQAPDWRGGLARPGHLPLFNSLGPVMYLTPAGDVVMNDEEDGPLRLADQAEHDFALARAAEQYPELAYLKPLRPQLAATCDRCCGRGKVTLSQGMILPWRDGQEPEWALYCPGCNSLGWTVTG
ncbi:hypothetical protein AB0M79_27605 [Polymorphospora sp. NPDC051019]|uniref:hypothetical protein n=1 Tax=Polymorphospora sp. NPDC051019 TaxID=3155725 RepID=UPI0034321673